MLGWVGRPLGFRFDKPRGFFLWAFFATTETASHHITYGIASYKAKLAV